MAQEQTQLASPGVPSLYRYSAVLKDTNGNGMPAVQLKLFDLNGTLLKSTTTQGTDNSPNNIDQYIYSLSYTTYPVEDGRFFWHDMEAGVYEVRAYGENLSTFAGSRASETFKWQITIGGNQGDFDDSSADIKEVEYVNRTKEILWCTRAVFDVFNDGTADVRQPSLCTVNFSSLTNSISPPENASNNTAYNYYSKDFDVQTPNVPADGPTISGMDVAIMYATYDNSAGGEIKIESTFNSGSSWYTWLDTQAGISRLGIEKDDTDFVDGTHIRVRVTLTTGSAFQKPILYDWGIFCGPDLYSTQFTDHYEPSS